MTLVELMVVIGILMLLMVTVAPILAPSSEQKGREAAATVIAMINRAQKRAIDREADAGIWLEPLLTSGSVRVINSVQTKAFVQFDGDTVAMAAIDMFACEPQDPYNGDDPLTARAFVYPVNGGGVTFVNGFRTDECLVFFEARSCAFAREICGQSSRITIDPGSGGKSYQFRLLSQAEQDQLDQNNRAYFPKPYRECNLGLSAGDPRYEGSRFYPGYSLLSSGTAPDLFVGWIRSDDGSDPVTSADPWSPNFDPGSPTFPTSSNVARPFAIQRPNTRTATPPLSLPAGYAIDVAWSSYGTVLLHNSIDDSVDRNRVGNGSQMRLIDNFLANQPVQVMFDSNGALKHVVVRKFITGFGVGSGASVDDETLPNADLFLLVGRADRVGRPFVKDPTDANPGANWQYPDSRWIKISAVTGKTLIADPYLNVNNVYDSQAYARSDIAALRN